MPIVCTMSVACCDVSYARAELAVMRTVPLCFGMVTFEGSAFGEAIQGVCLLLKPLFFMYGMLSCRTTNTRIQMRTLACTVKCQQPHKHTPFARSPAPCVIESPSKKNVGRIRHVLAAIRTSSTERRLQHVPPTTPVCKQSQQMQKQRGTRQIVRTSGHQVALK